MKIFIKKLDKLAKGLGFGTVKSYDKLYKTVINTYGRSDASMWFFTIALNSENQIVGIEVNSTYFKPTVQTIKINKIATFDSPLDIDKAIELISHK
jgi:hypothetical protein